MGRCPLVAASRNALVLSKGQNPIAVWPRMSTMHRMGGAQGPRVLGTLRGRLNPVTLGAATVHFLLADPQWYPARQSLRLDPSEYSCPAAFPLGAWGQETRAAPEY